MTPETAISITINQFIILLIFVITQTATIVGYFYYVMRRITKCENDNKTIKSELHTEIIHNYNNLETAFLNRNKFCDMKHELTKEKTQGLELKNNEAYNEFKKALEQFNISLSEFNKTLGEHIAFHKGQEEAAIKRTRKS